MTYVILIGLATLAVTDTLRRVSPWGLPLLLVRLLTLAGCLAGAWLWAPSPHLLYGLAAAGVAIVLPALVSTLSESQSVTSAQLQSRTVRRRMPSLP